MLVGLRPALKRHHDCMGERMHAQELPAPLHDRMMTLIEAMLMPSTERKPLRRGQDPALASHQCSLICLRCHHLRPGEVN